ncbi:MAG TPA: hypothetical protein VLL52_17030 [Anaerolineae bacterium]|nr:hypothetical protein [Anaerolineae bacterium]
MREKEAMVEERKKRPGCATAYAFVLWLLGGMWLVSLGRSYFDIMIFNHNPMGLTIFTSTVCGIGIIFVMGLGWGVWQMRGWGWLFVMLVHGAAFFWLLLVSLMYFLVAFQEPLGGVLGGSILFMFMLMQVGVLYWFVKKRALFGIEEDVGGSLSLVQIVIGGIMVLGLCVVAMLLLLSVWILFGSGSEFLPIGP